MEEVGLWVNETETYRRVSNPSRAKTVPVKDTFTVILFSLWAAGGTLASLTLRDAKP